jgi:FkbM family methyltransferase
VRVFYIIKNFFVTKRYLYFIPRNLRLKIFNLKKIKLYKTATGNYYLPQFALKGLIRNEIIDNKIFDKKVYEIAIKYVKDNTIVLDVGANFGQLSVLLSKCKNNVEVYSFEASNYIYQILVKNIRENNANVKPFYNLVGNKTEQDSFIKKLNISKFNTYGSNKIEKIEPQNSKNLDIEKINSVKIDDISFSKQISLMKIDVQGYDLEVLKGAKNTIIKYQMPIIFEYEEDFAIDFNYNFNSFEKFINEVNYKIEIQIDKSNFLILPK